MIQIRDLRVGNYITTYISDEIVQVVGLRTQRVKDGDYKTISVAADRHLLEDHVFGVKLSEDILLRCGFHRDNYGLFETVKDGEPYVSGCRIEFWVREYKHPLKNKVWEICMGENLDNLQHLCDIVYLHELQNIVRVIRGTELVVALQK